MPLKNKPIIDPIEEYEIKCQKEGAFAGLLLLIIVAIGMIIIFICSPSQNLTEESPFQVEISR